jgi:FkbM family methyltransferase
MFPVVNPPGPGSVRPVRGEKLLRGLHRLLPLGRKYGALFGLLNSRHDLVAVPFAGYHLVYPAIWRKAAVTQLLVGVDVVPEFRLLAAACGQLREGALIDLGANVGLYTLLLRSASPLPIIAYEPQPFLFRLLEWTVAFNHLPLVTLRNVGCGDIAGQLPFLTGINGGVLSGESDQCRPGQPAERGASGADWEQTARVWVEERPVIRVPIVTLDEDLSEAGPVALLKIDCEGFEYNILAGAKELLARDRPYLFLELHPALLETFGHSAAQVLELLSRHYNLEFWCFQHACGKSKLGRSLAKSCRPKGYRYSDAAEMLAAAGDPKGPSQIYALGQPKSAGTRAS